MRDSKRLPSLDGLRAVAISFVLLGHASHTALFPQAWKSVLARLPALGHFGVELFFVISGFVITHSLANEERDNDTVSLRAFYVRRVLRILPPVAAYLLFVFVLQAAGAIDLDRVEWVAALTFTRNFCAGHWITGHLWSLAVEEQFYLLWPFMFAFARFARWRLSFLLIVAAPICRY